MSSKISNVYRWLFLSMANTLLVLCKDGCSLRLCINLAFCCVIWTSIRKSYFVKCRCFIMRIFASELTFAKLQDGRGPPSLFPGTRYIARMSAGFTSMSARCLSILQKFSLRISFGSSRQPVFSILHFCEYCWLKFAIEMACSASLEAVVSWSPISCDSFLSFAICCLISVRSIFKASNFPMLSILARFSFYQHISAWISRFRIWFHFLIFIIHLLWPV